MPRPRQKALFELGQRWIARESGKPFLYASVDSVDTALRRWRIKPEVNVPRISVYSIRHRVASVLRAAKVPSEQISYQLGHRRPGDRTTREYGPDYLAEAAKALEVWERHYFAKRPAHTPLGPPPNV